jgi:transcription elongation factor GreA
MKKEEKNLNLLTEQGADKIKEEIEYRENVLREELAVTLNDMRSQGDLRENDGYSLAVEENEQNEEEIIRLKELLKKSKVIKNPGKTKVNVGNTVTISCDGQKDRVYTIVGEDHANPLENRISYKSPIGEALMGKKVGDKFKLNTPKGEIHCEIKSIE